MPHRGGRASAASERRSLRLALHCPHPLSSMAILVYVAERGKEAARDTHRREALGCGEGVRNPGVLWKNIPSWQVILGEGSSGHWVAFDLIPVAMPHFSLLGCHPQNRAHLCLLSHLWENLAFHLPVLLSVCRCLSGSLCLSVRRCASCCCGPMTTSSAGRKK